MDVLTSLQELFVVAARRRARPARGRAHPAPAQSRRSCCSSSAGCSSGPTGSASTPMQELELIANVGLGFVFLLAGFEIDPAMLFSRLGQAGPGRPGSSALVLAIGVVGVLAALGYVDAFVPVALALTTTALGTVLPILREQGMLGGAFGALLPRLGRGRESSSRSWPSRSSWA